MALTKVKASNITLSTPAANSNDTTPATTAYVTTAIDNLVDSSPAALNTLNELAAALNDDANFSTTVTNSIAAKAPLASPTFTSNINGGDGVELRLGDSQDILFKHHAGGYGHLENKTGTLYMDSETFTIRTDVDDLGTALFIDANQRVGIGETAPDRVLHVKRSDSGGTVAKFENSAGTVYVELNTNNQAAGDSGYISYDSAMKLGLWTDDQQRVTIDANGHVAFKTTDLGYPDYGDDLTIADSGHCGMTIRSGTSSNGTLYFSDDTGTAGGTYAGKIAYEHTNNKMLLATNTQNRMAIDSDGKVGIGTVSPDTLLNLKDTGSIELRLEADSDNSGQEDCFIRFYTDNKTQEGIAGMDNNNSSTLFSGNTENAMVFGTVSNLPTVFATNNTERMQITNGGQVMIATTSAIANAKLTVDGGDMMVHGSNNNMGISDLLPGYTRGDYGVVYSSANNIYFAVGSSYLSYIGGGSGQYTISDERQKENVSTLTGALDKVKQLRGVSFTWKDSTDRGTDTQIGLIAQEVEQVYPELVGDGDLPNTTDGEAPMKSVNYAHLTSVLIEAIKELEARVKELEG